MPTIFRITANMAIASPTTATVSRVFRSKFISILPKFATNADRKFPVRRYTDVFPRTAMQFGHRYAVVSVVAGLGCRIFHLSNPFPPA